MQKNTILIFARILLLVATSCIFNACGTKGPLYIPEQQYPQAPETK